MTCIIIPYQDAKFVEEADLSNVKKLVVVDSTWQQTKRILRDAQFAHMKRVKIRRQTTKFWRYQRHGDDHLATIEGNYK